MKILLVSTNITDTPYPVYPLGMGMIAAALEAAGYQTLQYDFMQHDASLETLQTFVREKQPDIIGLSIRNIDNVNLANEQRYIHIARDIVQGLKNVTEAPLILGGSGFSLMPEAILDACGADYGIVGEGENLMVDFVRNAAHKRFPSQPILRAPPALRGIQIPPANYDRRIMRYYLKNGKTASIQTKRGCTHKCAYCSYPLLEGSHIRCRDPRAVVDDIRRVIDEYGANMVFFTDSVFNDDAGHYLDVLRAMKKRGVRTPWVAFLKPERFDDETLSLMIDTGLRAVELGSDAPTDTTLRGLAKSFTFADIVACNRQLTAHGVAVAHYYMFGGPDETPDTVREGINNIVSLENSVAFMFMGIRILPATPLEQRAIRDGLIPPTGNLLEPVYYLAPGIDKDWLESTLTTGFKDHRHCVFPPDKFEAQVRLLHQLGHVGVLWDLLAPGGREGGARRRTSAGSGSTPGNYPKSGITAP